MNTFEDEVSNIINLTNDYEIDWICEILFICFLAYFIKLPLLQIKSKFIIQIDGKNNLTFIRQFINIYKVSKTKMKIRQLLKQNFCLVFINYGKKKTF